ncbi:universal stress protein [Qipengyuania sp. XHP0207]|uniref:universal stress protein n=1 Tax=Qipengyuania sp. XHP0207 TaxID=3038078 RepID=UPI00241E837B|nr:universal stress protein [Qipengyuania sp. XHP0207]MDG5748813.1 universal stress protein [Qipengyuania sp. XHP0207]
MKSILFNASGDDGFSGRLDAVLDIARAFDAHLTLLHAIPYEAAGAIDPYGAAFAAMVPVWREQAAKLRDTTLEDLSNEGVSWNWVEAAGPNALALLHESSLHDLVIVSAQENRGTVRGASFTAGELAVTADCPVLVLPTGCTRFALDAPALVAWDGSAEASHALKAAVPFLRHASAVYLVTVKEETKRKPKDSLPDLPPVGGADYLSRHGIACEMVELNAEKGGVAEALRKAAEARKAGLVVMGAYGRTRLAERIFGGTTHTMLAEVEIPLLMTH